MTSGIYKGWNSRKSKRWLCGFLPGIFVVFLKTKQNKKQTGQVNKLSSSSQLYHSFYAWTELLSSRVFQLFTIYKPPQPKWLKATTVDHFPHVLWLAEFQLGGSLLLSPRLGQVVAVEALPDPEVRDGFWPFCSSIFRLLIWWLGSLREEAEAARTQKSTTFYWSKKVP